MITQPVTEDYWHAYAFGMLAKLDELTKADRDYAKQIADIVIVGEVRSLHPTHTSISTATKVEALAALAQAFAALLSECRCLEPGRRIGSSEDRGRPFHEAARMNRKAKYPASHLSTRKRENRYEKDSFGDFIQYAVGKPVYYLGLLKKSPILIA